MTVLRINPISLVLDHRLHFQSGGKLNSVLLTRDRWKVIKQFYQLPTLAPQTLPADGLDVDSFVRAGILVPHDQLFDFLRSERHVIWWQGEKQTVRFLLAACQSGVTFWFEHDGRKPILFFHRGSCSVAAGGQIADYDGVSFGFESTSVCALADNKAATHVYLAQRGCCVPPQVMVYPDPIPRNARSRIMRSVVAQVLRNAPHGLTFPVVVKPVHGSVGRGVAFAADETELGARLFDLSQQERTTWAVVENAVRGREWRVTVISDGTHAAYERTGFSLTGDGRSSIADLIKVQQDIRREVVRTRGYLRPPSLLTFSDSQERILSVRGLSRVSVLPTGTTLQLAERPHATLGGLYHDASEQVPRDIVDRLQGIRESMGLDRAGFDLIGDSWDGKLFFIEVNSRPHVSTHAEPDFGSRRDIVRPLLEMALTRSDPRGILATLSGPCLNARVALRTIDNRLTRWLQRSFLGPECDDAMPL